MAASDYYDHSNYPTANSLGSSQAMRNEFDAVEAGFGKLPNLTGTNDWLVRVKADGTGLEAFSTFSDTTIANVSTSAHGLTPKLPGGTTSFLRGDGSWAPTTAAALLAVTRTSNTVLDVTNSGNCITYTTGGFTQTVNAAATLSNGWFTYLRNTSTSTVTVDPSGSETIDGATTLSLRPNDTRLLMCDGTGFRSIPVSGNAGRTLIATITPTAASTAINFLTTFSSLYDDYEIIISGLVPAGPGSLAFNFAVGGVVDSGSNYYTPQNANVTTPISTVGMGAPDNVGSTNGRVIVTNANASTGTKGFIASFMSRNVTNTSGNTFEGTYANAGVVSGFRILITSSTFTAVGTIRVYGLRKDI